jgi:hypothetical protein
MDYALLVWTKGADNLIPGHNGMDYGFTLILVPVLFQDEGGDVGDDIFGNAGVLE